VRVDPGACFHAIGIVGRLGGRLALCMESGRATNGTGRPLSHEWAAVGRTTRGELLP